MPLMGHEVEAITLLPLAHLRFWGKVYFTNRFSCRSRAYISFEIIIAGLSTSGDGDFLRSL